LRTKYFTHKPLPKIEVPRKEIDGKRYYVTPGGECYRSVTTILSQLTKDDIQKWRDRVGEQEANKISSSASRRGTKLHLMMEDYVGNVEDFALNKMPTTTSLFLDIQPFVDSNLEEVYGIEYPLYSDRLRAAGTSDLICKYAGKPTVLDYKTSSKRKKEEWIENYFIQSTAYALMVKERYDLDIEQIVIMIAVEGDNPQVFVKDPSDYVKKTISIFDTY
jgi:ATP-dependent exoDNAse (exonuclease V) beta subunit